jgi:hypothetical protein
VPTLVTHWIRQCLDLGEVGTRIESIFGTAFFFLGFDVETEAYEESKRYKLCETELGRTELYNGLGCSTWLTMEEGCSHRYIVIKNGP